MSFRHHTGHQKDRCLLLAARMAALELLFKREEIDIPPPRRRASIQGASGQLHTAEVAGQRELVRIRAREWVDSQAARLTLEDGRVILLKLDSSFAVDDAGVYSGVITIRVNDPAIASWTREEILASAFMDDGLLCWQRHWQDPLLEAEASRQAEDAAVQLIDHLPGGGQDYEGLTVAQRSESVLHGAIKIILEKAGGLTVPPYAFEEKVALPNGKTWSETYGFQFGFLRMVDVRLEKVLGRIVPDVLCRACTQDDDFPLMIEVVVTHPVTLEKLQHIRAQGVACLQIDVSHFQKSGRMTLEGLKWEVLKNPNSKRWLFHPGLERRQIEARQRGHEALQAVVTEMRKHRAVLELLYSTPSNELPQRLLEVVLANERSIRAGLGVLTDFQEILELLKANGWDANDAPLLQPGGVLSALATVRDHAKGNTRRVLDALVIVAGTPRVRVHTGLILIAVKVYGVEFTAVERTEHLRIRQMVQDSFKEGDLQFGRPTRHDGLIGWIFPEMALLLDHRYGTAQYAREQKEILARAAADKLRQEMEDLKRTGDARDQALQVKAVGAAIAGIRAQWNPPLAICRDFEQAMRSSEVTTFLKRMRDSEIDFEEALAIAFQARDAGVPVAQWVLDRKPLDVDQVRHLTQLLSAAWLI
jgi:hypothetical protein